MQFGSVLLLPYNDLQARSKHAQHCKLPQPHVSRWRAQAVQQSIVLSSTKCQHDNVSMPHFPLPARFCFSQDPLASPCKSGCFIGRQRFCKGNIETLRSTSYLCIKLVQEFAFCPVHGMHELAVQLESVYESKPYSYSSLATYQFSINCLDV